MDIDKIFWEEYKISNIVQDIHNAHPYNSNDLVRAETDDYIPYITRTDVNNGISDYVVNLPYSGLEKGNAITIGDTTATIFYQDRDFIAGPHIIVLHADWFNTYTATFLVSMLIYEKFKYPAFGRAFTKDLISDTYVILPSNSDGTPNFKLMEDFIKDLKVDITSIPDYFLDEGYKKAWWYIDNVNAEKFESEYAGILQKNNISLSDREWKEFCLGDKDYFVVQRGESQYLKNAGVGDIPYVSTTNENNGTLNYTGLCNREGNLISLAYDGSIGACFYQDKPFFASEKIVTIDLVEVELNQYIAMFLIPILQLKSELYSYGGRKWAVNEQMLKSNIKLPVNAAGKPDYQFMEDYIKSLPFSAKL